MLNKVYTFEVTPTHPTRKVYDKVLFPDGFAYYATMTPRQAIAAMHTCRLLKVKADDGKLYPVSRETIDEVLTALDAGTTPTVAAVDAGVHTMASFLSVAPADTDVYGKNVGELADIAIERLEVTGTVYYATGYTGFNGSVVEEQEGYYFPFVWDTTNTEFTAAAMRIPSGKHPDKKVTLDKENVILLGHDEYTARKAVIEISAKNKDGEEVCMYLNLAKLKLDKNPSPYVKPVTPPAPAPENPVVNPAEDVVG